MTLRRKMIILMADDDEDDRLLAEDALRESGENAQLQFVDDGVQLLDYLRNHTPTALPASSSNAKRRVKQPDLILLDLNMPRLDGREALKQIKNDPALRRTPVVILTTSRSEQDIWEAYDEGANSYVAKPVSFDGLVEVMKNLRRYWAETVQLPSENQT